MALTKEIMAELDKQAKAEDAKEKADLEKLRPFHESAEYAAMETEAEADAKAEEAERAKGA